MSQEDFLSCYSVSLLSTPPQQLQGLQVPSVVTCFSHDAGAPTQVPVLIWQVLYLLVIFPAPRPFPILSTLSSGIIPEYNAWSITVPIKHRLPEAHRLKDFIKQAVCTGRAHLFEADSFQLNYKCVSVWLSARSPCGVLKYFSLPSSWPFCQYFATHQVLSLHLCPPWPTGVVMVAAELLGAW